MDRLDTQAKTIVGLPPSHSVARRAVESFFRRWPLYLLLLALCLLLGLINLRTISRSYTSNGAMFVQQRTLLESQVSAEYGSEFNRLPPSNYVSQELIGLVQTDEFMDSVAVSAGYELGQTLSSRRQLSAFFRSALVIEPLTENLVLIGASTEDPDESQELATSVIESYIEFQVNASTAAGAIAGARSGAKLEEMNVDLLAARAEVDALLSRLAGVETLSDANSAELDRLQVAEVEAQRAFRQAVARSEDVKAVRARLETQARQRFAFVGQPDRPDVPDGAGLDGIFAMISFALVGIVATILAPSVSASRTRTVLVPDDLAKISPATPTTTVPAITRGGIGRQFFRTASGVRLPHDPDGVGSSIDHMWIRAALRPSARPRSVAVSSAISGEGVSTISMALATSASIIGPTLLVDGNMARPGVEEGPGQGGLRGVLAGTTTLEEAIETTDRPDLHVLSSGSVGNDGPFRELDPALASELVEALSMGYETVIFDCPPLTASPEALALASTGSALLLVVRHGVTDIDQVENAIGQVADADVLGLVMNAYRPATPRWLRRKLGWQG